MAWHHIWSGCVLGGGVPPYLGIAWTANVVTVRCPAKFRAGGRLALSLNSKPLYDQGCRAPLPVSYHATPHL